ncbi:Holliday junction resolvase RecU [Brevibacillus nitrificans]|uniref:Holliday junction resolvase RecU n=1 Tax=Brevibacillus nitrificans TaxID=651560 RepID=UPI00285BB983|nr:Holliday junction resolvase RecU [Brevibacillus nitrificans]MDR7318886.1 recombination protein U [Brevibacillus nitrificans]
MPMRFGHANRGKGFENQLNLTNSQYQRKGIALIDKRTTPVKVLRTNGNHITDAVYDKKSTVDYYGTYKGRSIYFEAKSTAEVTRFDLKNIDDHQYDHLEAAEKYGAICFVLIEFTKSNEVMFVPFSTIKQYRLHASTGGRKSIPKDDFEYYAYLVSKTKRANLDYLLHVDRMIGTECIAT